MATVTRQTRGVVQLLRVKPVLSWGVASFLLGAALAYGRVGMDLNWLHGGLAILGVVLAQGLVSHGLNDAYDWITGTDKESIGKGTGGSRVIPEGKMTVAGTIVAALAGLAGVLAIGGYFYAEYGWPILVLLAIAVWSPVSYSVPPLKLGYRPFNEFLVVLPALVGVVVGTELVLTGTWTLDAALVGWLHAMFCISWFIVSRVPDYTPDKRVGKVTSVVFLGRDNAAVLSAAYLGLGLSVVPLLAVTLSPVFAASVVAWGLMLSGLLVLDPYDEEVASEIRLQNMHITTAHAFGIAIGLVLLGV